MDSLRCGSSTSLEGIRAEEGDVTGLKIRINEQDQHLHLHWIIYPVRNQTVNHCNKEEVDRQNSTTM